MQFFVQISEVCSMLQADPNLVNGYHGIGISQVRYKLILIVLITDEWIFEGRTNVPWSHSAMSKPADKVKSFVIVSVKSQSSIFVLLNSVVTSVAC